jgi:hypothetical protein
MRAYDAFWGSALGVFLLSAVVSAAMMGPPSRRAPSGCVARSLGTARP